MAKIVMLEGYSGSGGKRKSRRGHGRKSAGFHRQQQKMKGCARKCKGGGGYRSCMTSCLRKK